MKLNIFDYMDHRTFIKDYYDLKKTENSKFSYRLFAKKAGFSSSAFLPLLISGKRTMKKDSVRRLAAVMGLSKKEYQYFELLVWLNQADDEATREYYRQLLNNLKSDKPGAMIRDEQFEYLSNWYYPVIRELVTIPGFKEDKVWIKRQLDDRVTVRQVRDAIDNMLKLELLARDANGRLKQTEASLFTEDEVAHTAVLTVHQQMLALANNILMATKGIGNEISGMTMAVSQRQFKEIVAMIRELQNDITKYLSEHSDVPETVAQFNVQFFHILNNGKGGLTV